MIPHMYTYNNYIRVRYLWLPEIIIMRYISGCPQIKCACLIATELRIIFLETSPIEHSPPFIIFDLFWYHSCTLISEVYLQLRLWAFLMNTSLIYPTNSPTSTFGYLMGIFKSTSTK